MKKILFVAMALLLFACSDEEKKESKEGMTVNISIPSYGDYLTRAEGDPGSTDFSLPQYLYLYVVTKNSSGTYDVTKPPATPFVLDPSKWVYSNWYAEEPQTKGDGYYRYSDPPTLQLPDSRTEGWVYAFVSTVALTVPDVTTISALSDIENLQVTFPDDNGEYRYLRNVYSSPISYKTDGVNYYGTIHDILSNAPYVDMMLYHLAAKIDLKWNVPVDQQANAQLSSLTISNLKKTNCYIFRPSDNIGLGDPSWSVTENFEVDKQWYGRYSTYIIPYRASDESDYEISLKFNDTNTTITIDKDKLNGQAFAPWIIWDVTLTHD